MTSSATVAALSLNFGADPITACCRGVTQSSYDHVWEYHEPDIADEIWKPVHDLQVSSEGRVRFSNGRVTRGCTRAGYHYVKIQEVEHAVHELVCLAFHGEPREPDMVVNHRDECGDNNRADNLEWLSFGDNIRYSHNKGLQQLVGDQIVAVATATGIALGRISNIFRMGRGTSNEYGWQYLPEVTVETGSHANGKLIEQYSVDGAYITTYTSAEDSTWQRLVYQELL
jgi:hypothetical protein